MKEPTNTALSTLIKKARLERGLSLYELGRRLNMPASTIYRIEEEGAIPSTSRLDAIARELGLDPTEVMSAAGHEHLAELPSLPHYLRTKYPDMPDEAFTDLSKTINRLADKYGFDPDHTSPHPGEDEH